MSKYTVINDPEHGFLRVDPIPTEDEVNTFYKEEFYSDNYKNFNDSAIESQKQEKLFNDMRWQRMYEVCCDHFGSQNDLSICDIGFGYGFALQFFKEKGYLVSGIEPSEDAVQYAKQNGIHNAVQGSMDDFSAFNGKTFNVVSLINVLEHLRAPYKCLTEVRESLIATNGLLILDVPNEYNDFQVVADKEYNLKEWWLSPPNHINYFTTSSLKALVEKAGFEIVTVEASFPLEMFMLFGDVYVGDGDIGKSVHNKRVLFETLMKKHGKADKLNAFYQSLADLDLGRQAVLFAKPK